MKKILVLALTVAALPAIACEQQTYAHNYDQDPPAQESKLIASLVATAQDLAAKATSITGTVLTKVKDASTQSIASTGPYDADPRPIQDAATPANAELVPQQQAPH